MAESARLFVAPLVESDVLAADRRAVDAGEVLVRTTRACVLVADISGFTPLEVRLNKTGRAGIEAFAETMHRVFEMLCHITDEAEGTVLEFAGDALFCCFEVDGAAQDAAAADAAAVARVRKCAHLMLRGMRDFPDLRLHGGAALGDVISAHLCVPDTGAAPAAGPGEKPWQRRCVFMGDALVKATQLLDASAKGEICFEGGESLTDTGPDFAEELTLAAAPEPSSQRQREEGDAAGARRSLDAHRRSFEVQKRVASWWQAWYWDKTKARCQKSWEIVKQDLELQGVAFFRNIFESAPAVLPLFSFGHIPVPELYDSPELKAHGVRVLSTVGTVVAGLNDIEKLVPVLRALGDRHRDVHGIVPEFYPVVGAALIKTLRDGLGDLFTPDVEAAWLSVYNVVQTTMTRADQKDDKAGSSIRSRTAADSLLATSEVEGIDSWFEDTVQTYLSKCVANHLEGGGKLERISEVRTIASVFVCLPDPPGGVVGNVDTSALNKMFEQCWNLVEQYRGIINQFLWDDKGLILKAAWGMYRPTDHDELNATRFAMDVTKLLGARAGVASGVAFCGLVGADTVRLGRVMFGAESVTLAARLMMKASPGSALCSESVRDATSAHIAYEGEHRPKLVLKGREKDEAVCIPVATIDPADSRRTILRREMPGANASLDGISQREFALGREHEIQVVARLVESAVSQVESCSSVRVKGEPGLGKRAIVNEAIRRVLGKDEEVTVVSISLTSDMRHIEASAAQRVLEIFQPKEDERTSRNRLTRNAKQSLHGKQMQDVKDLIAGSSRVLQQGPRLENPTSGDPSWSTDRSAASSTSNPRALSLKSGSSSMSMKLIKAYTASRSRLPTVGPVDKSSSEFASPQFDNSLDLLSQLDRVLRREAPMVLVLNKAQCVDSQSRRQLRLLSSSVHRICVVYVYDVRPRHSRRSLKGEGDVESETWQDDDTGSFVDVDVRPLEHGIAVDVAKQIMSETHGVADAGLATLIADMSQGYISHIRLLARSMDSTNQSSNGSEQLKRAPDTMRGSIVNAIDKLKPIEVDILKAASVIGNDVRTDILTQLVKCTVPELNGILIDLALRGIISLSPTGNATRRIERFEFVHPIVRESFYDLMLEGQVQEMHRVVAAYYELDLLTSPIFADLSHPLHVHEQLVNHYAASGLPFESAVHAAAAAGHYAKIEEYRSALSLLQVAMNTISDSVDVLAIVIAAQWSVQAAGMSQAQGHRGDAQSFATRALAKADVGLRMLASHRAWSLFPCCSGGAKVVPDAEELYAIASAAREDARAILKKDAHS